MFKKYRRKGLSEMRPYTPGEDLTGITVSDADKALPEEEFNKGFIARNPDNHTDQWYVNGEYHAKNLEEVTEEELEAAAAQA